MWNRKSLKTKAKENFKKNYWASVVSAAVLMFFVVGSASGGPAAGDRMQDAAGQDQFITELGFLDPDKLPALLLVFAGIVLSAFVASTLVGIFVGKPFIIGGRKFFQENRKQGKAGLGSLLYAFRCGNYLNIVKTMLVKSIFLFLWSCLFFIPGIVKSYSYWMVEFIMTENPSISYKRAFEISRKTMNGEKWNVFVLDLSFIPWYVLAVCTCGLSSLFYLNPYMCATDAELYAKLKEKALSANFATAEELPG